MQLLATLLVLFWLVADTAFVPRLARRRPRVKVASGFVLVAILGFSSWVNFCVEPVAPPFFKAASLVLLVLATLFAALELRLWRKESA